MRHHINFACLSGEEILDTYRTAWPHRRLSSPPRARGPLLSAALLLVKTQRLLFIHSVHTMPPTGRERYLFMLTRLLLLLLLSCWFGLRLLLSSLILLR